MSLSSPFIARPVGTTLLTIAVLIAGAVAYTLLPVAHLPQVEFPTVQVSAGLPGANPETMATAVATPQFAGAATTVGNPAGNFTTRVPESITQYSAKPPCKYGDNSHESWPYFFSDWHFIGNCSTAQ